MASIVLGLVDLNYYWTICRTGSPKSHEGWKQAIEKRAAVIHIGMSQKRVEALLGVHRLQCRDSYYYFPTFPTYPEVFGPYSKIGPICIAYKMGLVSSVRWIPWERLAEEEDRVFYGRRSTP
jgi:hypothetical protein